MSEMVDTEWEEIARAAAEDVAGSDATKVGLVISAEPAMQAFDRVPADKQTDVLALMMVGARG